ncbi:TIGR03089 family protein [Nesterenkonia flava]|uniref:TIGR03089 family protein n=1 Tax=Nesterenkonia flava TaxID=469799 RepID=A0ABU1FQ77_9MICC|nr:TIGR03089 family protein [Nesterenkonia flava]MDR5710789.1 TIGR03089 family protein [Nesterenkonia flava]
MSPLSLGSGAASVPTEFGQLLEVLGSRPQPALVWYDGRPAPSGAPSGERVELSGRVLQNWAVKLIGLFEAEQDLQPGDEVLVDMTPHWKAAAVLLAVGAMGARVRVEPQASAEVARRDELGGHASGAGDAHGGQKPLVDEDGAPVLPQSGSAVLVVTDRPEAWLDSEALADAELAAVSPGMLDASFEEATGHALPAWVLDVSAEVRQHPDQLTVRLPEVLLPELSVEPANPLVISGWGQDTAEAMVGAWARGGVVVLFAGEPRGEVWEQMLRNEGLA